MDRSVARRRAQAVSDAFQLLDQLRPLALPLLDRLPAFLESAEHAPAALVIPPDFAKLGLESGALVFERRNFVFERRGPPAHFLRLERIETFSLPPETLAGAAVFSSAVGAWSGDRERGLQLRADCSGGFLHAAPVLQRP